MNCISSQGKSMATVSSTRMFSDKKKSDSRWAIILAGGDGSRLLPLTRQLTGDERPKQFCRIFGDGTLLDVTRRRVELAIHPAKTLVVLTEKHSRYYEHLLLDIPIENLVVQPQNIGTAPAILLSLLHLQKLDPEACVAFFPSDHYFSNDAAFMGEVDLAFDAADINPNTVILMGIRPEQPDEQYGWIEPDFSFSFDSDSRVWPVSRFWEKPERTLAIELMGQGCLWNSFVMVGKVSGFLNMIRLAAPMLFHRFEMIRSDLRTAREKDAIRRLYALEPNSNFSTEILMSRPTDLAVVPVARSGWSDMGSPERVASTLSGIGRRQIVLPKPTGHLKITSETYHERERSCRSQAV